MIRDIIVHVDALGTEVTVVIHWKDDVHIELRLPRRSRDQNTTFASEEIVEAVRVLITLLH